MTPAAPAPAPAPAPVAAESPPSRPALDELRTATGQLLSAERRLRSRDHTPGELTHAHIRSLHALSEGPLTAGQLARSAELNPASVTAMLDHLERDGIVERTRSTTDRRVCIVALTEQGSALLAAKTAAWRDRWARRLDGYSDAELAIAERVIRDVAGIMDSVVQEREAAAAARSRD
jgi:MarR family transcriptional regulator, organic hydroperoxide resistance regulator